METKNIADYLKADTINLNLESKNKNAIIKERYFYKRRNGIYRNW